jgi:hypothetical protein
VGRSRRGRSQLPLPLVSLRRGPAPASTKVPSWRTEIVPRVVELFSSRLVSSPPGDDPERREQRGRRAEIVHRVVEVLSSRLVSSGPGDDPECRERAGVAGPAFEGPAGERALTRREQSGRRAEIVPRVVESFSSHECRPVPATIPSAGNEPGSQGRRSRALQGQEPSLAGNNAGAERRSSLALSSSSRRTRVVRSRVPGTSRGRRAGV